MIFTLSLVALASFLALRGGREGLKESGLAVGLTGIAILVLFRLGFAG